MGRGSADQDRRGKIAAQRAAAQRTQRRNRMLIAGGAIIAVIAVVISFVLLSGNSTPSTSSGGASAPPTGSALDAVVTKTTTVPAATLDQVGAGQVSATPTAITGTPLTSGGKPEMLYMGAEYCPYCAAERWAMVVALSRFGTFSGLSTVHSGNNTGEVFPNTATYTFDKSTYTSKYLTFTPVEMQTNIPAQTANGLSYTTLQTPTTAQQALLTKYDAPPYSTTSGSIPFIDFGNKYVLVGSSYSPQVLQGQSWSQIGAALKDPNSPIAKAVDGTANYLTAAICKLTGNQPASACTPVVQQLEAK